MSKKWLLVCASLMLIACGGDDGESGDDRDRDDKGEETGKIGNGNRSRDAAVTDAGPAVRTDADAAVGDTRQDGGAILTRDAGIVTPSTPPTPPTQSDDAGSSRPDAGGVVQRDAGASITAADRAICEAGSGEPGTCSACVSAECCGETLACLRNTQCTQIMNCISECPSGNQSCITGCQTRSPGGVAAMQAMAACGQDQCAAACQD